MIDSLSASDYRALVGATDGPTEMTAEQFRQMRGNPMSASDLVPRYHNSEVDTEPKRKRDFAEWLEFVASPFIVALESMIVPGRKFRADWDIMELKIAIEYDGVVDHATKRGAWRDAEKGNLIQLEGYLFLRVNALSIADGSAFTIVQRAIDLRTGAG